MSTKRHSNRSKHSKTFKRRHSRNKGGNFGISNSFSRNSNTPSNMMTASDRRLAAYKSQQNKIANVQYNKFLNNLDSTTNKHTSATRLYYDNKQRQGSYVPSRSSYSSRNRGGRKTKKIYKK